jgi:hypothetical protein
MLELQLAGKPGELLKYMGLVAALGTARIGVELQHR